jgi:amino acid adenylation domain-containing protein
VKIDREQLRHLSSEEKRALLARLLERETASDGEFPLSHGQRALWFLHKFVPQSAAYNVNLAARIESRIDVDALRQALQALTDRHAVLRAAFPDRAGVPVMRVPAQAPVHFALVDASGWTGEAIEADLTDHAHQPFDLETGPIFRVRLYARPPHEHILLVSVHHIVYDAVSLAVLLDELGTLYGAAAAGRAATLPPLRYQFADYVRWQNALLENAAGERLWAYWKQELAGDLPDLNLPTDRPRPPFQTSRGGARVFNVDDDLTRGLRALAAANETTLFVVLLAAFQALLHRYTGQPDILVGTPMAGRTRPEFQSVVGYFINAAVLRADLSGDPPFTEFLAQARRKVLGALAHQDYPFSLLVERLQPDRDTSRSPLFQTMFNMPSAHRLDARSVSQFVLGEAGGRVSLGGLDLELFPVEQQSSMFDLLLSMAATGDRLAGSLQYNADLFDPETIERMAGHYRAMLQSIVDAPGHPISELPLLPPDERHRLLVTWNDTARPYPRDETFPALFEAQVARTPERVAALCGDHAVTYRELNARADRLAGTLREHGAGTDVVVAVLAERSIEFLTAMIAAFKAGAAYLPLDPRHPAPRHAQVLAQSRSPLVLTAHAFLSALETALDGVPEADRPRILILEEALRNPAHRDGPAVAPRTAECLPVRPAPRDLAYVIYTSGSTGMPKGAMVEQRGMINHLYAKIGDLRLTDRDVVAQTASQCFDISVWQFLAALLVGGRTLIVNDDVARDPAALLDLVAAHGVTILETVPSLLLMMVEDTVGIEPPHLASLRWMIPTGEALPPEVCRAWFRLYPEIPLVNAYGPTECSDDVTHHPIYTPPPVDVLHIPIGRPIANTRLYILDARMQPVPAGVVGELCVAGDGVGRGYLNDAARTAEVFVPEPFVSEPGARMYRTGDLARYQRDGVIEFLGRRDHQVKIRGFRIELGEIEAVLDRHSDVRDCVVIARDDGPGRKRLVAYVVPANGAPAAGDLRGFLRDHLPEYMVPVSFVFLEALPLTPNGKVDRRALPAPPAEAAEPDANYVAPHTPTERALAAIWAEILGLDRVGAHDNFFALGGDSIVSIRILARAGQAGISLTPTQFFQYQTVSEQAAAADAAAAHTSNASQPRAGQVDATLVEPVVSDAERAAAIRAAGLAPDQVEAVFPLSPMQRVMLAHTLADPHAGVYFEQLSCTVRGALDMDAFAAAWEQTAQRHQTLRTRFVVQGLREPLQVVAHDARPPWDRRDLQDRAPPCQRAAIADFLAGDVARGFDLTDSPPLRFALFRVAPDVHHFVWSIHHLLLDAWSGGILLREVFDLYDAARHGRHLQLDPARPYQDYITWLRAQDPAQAEAYWRRALAGLEHTALPREGSGLRAPGGEPAYAERRGVLSEISTARLQAFAREHRLTLNTMVQAAWALALGRRTAAPEVVFGVTTSGRPAGLAGVESMVGLFINTLPLRVRVAEDVPLSAWLHGLQETQARARLFEYCSLDEIRTWGGLPGNQPLFDSVLRFQNYPVAGALRERIGSLRLEDVRFLDMWAYPLCLVAEPGGELSLSITYDRRRVAEHDVAALHDDLLAWLSRVTVDPDRRVSDLRLAAEPP